MRLYYILFLINICTPQPLPILTIINGTTYNKSKLSILDPKSKLFASPHGLSPFRLKLYLHYIIFLTAHKSISTHLDFSSYFFPIIALPFLHLCTYLYTFNSPHLLLLPLLPYQPRPYILTNLLTYKLVTILPY